MAREWSLKRCLEASARKLSPPVRAQPAKDGTCQEREQKHQDCEEEFAGRLFKLGREIMEPGKLDQRLVKPTAGFVVVQKFGDINLGHKAEPNQDQRRSADGASQARAAPGN